MLGLDVSQISDYYSPKEKLLDWTCILIAGVVVVVFLPIALIVGALMSGDSDE